MDVVILCMLFFFCLGYLEVVVEVGKYIFCEKLVVVDVLGICWVIEVVKKVKEKNLVLMLGFCWRYDFLKCVIYECILNGDIGKVIGIYNIYNIGVFWERERKMDWNDMEFIMCNWLYYNWFFGDYIVE